MEADSIYTDLDPTPAYSIVDVEDAADTGLAFSAEAGDTLYVEVTNLSDSDSDCELDVIDINFVTVIGYAGPYHRSHEGRRETVCGALFTVAADVLTSGTDEALQVSIGNAEQYADFTIYHPDSVSTESDAEEEKSSAEVDCDAAGGWRNGQCLDEFAEETEEESAALT